MIFREKRLGPKLSFLLFLGGLFSAVGCSPRRFNDGSENVVKSSDIGAQSEFEVCGKQYDFDKGGDVRVIRLNPLSATLLSSKRGDSNLQRYVQIDLSAIEDKEVKEKFRQCYVVSDSKGVLIASRARAMNADEDYASFEIVACGKLKEDTNGFKMTQATTSAKTRDVWIIDREKSFESKLQEIVSTQSDICVIGKPIKFETGIAIIFDTQSYAVAKGSK